MLDTRALLKVLTPDCDAPLPESEVGLQYEKLLGGSPLTEPLDFVEEFRRWRQHQPGRKQESSRVVSGSQKFTQHGEDAVANFVDLWKRSRNSALETLSARMMFAKPEDVQEMTSWCKRLAQLPPDGARVLRTILVSSRFDAYVRYAQLWNLVREAQNRVKKEEDEALAAKLDPGKTRTSQEERLAEEEVRMKMVQAGADALSKTKGFGISSAEASAFSVQVLYGAISPQFGILKTRKDEQGLIQGTPQEIQELVTSDIKKRLKQATLIREAGPILEARTKVKGLSASEQFDRDREWLIHQWQPETWYIVYRPNEVAKAKAAREEQVRRDTEKREAERQAKLKAAEEGKLDDYYGSQTRIDLATGDIIFEREDEEGEMDQEGAESSENLLSLLWKKFKGMYQLFART